jgi:hypothetical protein
MNCRSVRWASTESAKFGEFRERQILELLDLHCGGADFPNRRYWPITQIELGGILHSARVAQAKEAQA